MVTLHGSNGRYAFDPLDPATRLGQGGMGVVFRGVETSSGRAVAVKVLYRELSAQASHVERARREAAIQIRHENLLEMLDFVELKGIYHSVSELLEGETLARRLDALRAEGEFLPLPEIKRVGEALLNALEALHTQQPRIIHRDVDPSNLMLCADGRIKLMDFGVVKLSDGVRKSLTGLGAILGKPHYAAPEQIRNRPDDVVDESTDLYAAGITLYELLTGQVPFDAPNEYDLMQLQIQQPLPRHPRLPRTTFQFLQTATAKDQRRRYRTAALMRRDLDRLAGPVLPRQPPWQRRPLLIAALTLPLLLLVIGFFYQRQSGRKARYQALCERAEAFRRQARYDSAARVFGEALVVWETDSIRSRKKGMENLPNSIALFQRKRYGGAASSFAADTLDPSAREAFYYLGILRFYGLGTPADTQRAVAFYRHAARLGYALAQVRLGNALVNGWGVRVDFAEAEAWYQLARADSTGFARGDALYGLYYLYASGGNGLTRDFPRSLGFLRASARVGSLEAMHRLGVKYRYGDALLTQNPDSARFWLRLAAGAGHREATRQLQELGGTNPFNLNPLFDGTRRKPTPPRRRRSSFWENLFGPSRRTPSKR